MHVGQHNLGKKSFHIAGIKIAFDWKCPKAERSDYYGTWISQDSERHTLQIWPVTEECWFGVTFWLIMGENSCSAGERGSLGKADTFWSGGGTVSFYRPGCFG